MCSFYAGVLCFPHLTLQGAMLPNFVSLPFCLLLRPALMGAGAKTTAFMYCGREGVVYRRVIQPDCTFDAYWAVCDNSDKSAITIYVAMS